MKKVTSSGYQFPLDYAPSDVMLDGVGLDFDDDLGGLQKGPRVKRPRLHLLWWLFTLIIPIALIAINPTYGFGFISGIIIGIVYSKICLH